MTTLPRAADVPSATSGRDPGVRVPEGAFSSPIGVVAEEVAPGIEKLAEIKHQQESRRDTIDRADQLNRFREETDKELRRVQAEEDLSSDETVEKFGRFMTDSQQALLDEHGGSQDSRARLIMRLSNINSEFTGQAAGISAKIGREKVEKLFNDQLSPLITRAFQNPSVDNVNRLFIDFEEVINDMRGAFDPSQEEALRQAGRQHIALSSLEPLLVRGKVETAEAMLIEGGLSKYLTPEAQRNVMHRLETIRYNRDKTDADLSEKEKFRRNMMSRGYSESLAFDISSGAVDIVGPDPSGKYHTINKVTREKKGVPEEDQENINMEIDIARIRQDFGVSESAAREMVEGGFKSPSTTTEPAKPVAEPIEKAVEAGTGPFAKAQETISNVFGPFWEGTFFKNTTDARQKLKLFNQQAKSAFAKNPKFPVAEMKIILEALPDTGKFFKDPDASVNDIKVLRKTLAEMKASKEKQLASGRTTSRLKANLSDQISTVDEVLDMMGPEEQEALTISSQEEVDKLEKGTTFIWTDGKTYTKE